MIHITFIMIKNVILHFKCEGGDVQKDEFKEEKVANLFAKRNQIKCFG